MFDVHADPAPTASWWSGLTPSAVIQRISEEAGLSRQRVIGQVKDRYLVNVRFRVATVLREMGIGYKQIGRHLGGRDHSTIIALLKRGERKYQTQGKRPAGLR